MTTPLRLRKTCPVAPETGIKSDDTFCWKCGAVLVTGGPLRCACGRDLGLHDHFCTACGRKVDTVAAQSQAAP